MARQNRRSGDIDFLSIAEGGSGVSDLAAFRDQHGFIAKDDPRVIKVLPGNSGAPELKIDSVADLSVIRPDLSGPSKINPGETIQFLIQNRDVSVNYEVSSSHGYVRQEDGIIYFTLTNNSSAISVATFNVNGFTYSVEVSSSGPLTGTVLLSAVKTYDSIILNIKASDFKSNDASVLSGIEYQVSSNYDFTDIVHASKASGLNDKITIGITDTLYVRVRYITAAETYGNWFYSEPVITSELKNSVAKPYGVGAITTDSSTYTLLLRGSKFLSAIDLTLKSIEVEEYSDAILSKLTNATTVTTTSEDIQSVYTPSSTYVYIRFRYVDSMNNKSEWSNTIRLSANGAYKTLPVAEVQKIVEPYPYAQGEFGFRTEISQDGKLMVASSHFNNKNGAFYIFKRINDKWSMHQFITYPDTPGTSSAAFANALKITPDAKTIFVGARNAFSDMSGAVYVYAYDLASDSWVKRDTITNHDKIAQSSFGTGIIISKDGTKLIISDTIRGTLFSGKTRVDPRLYFYSYNGTTWTLDQTLSFTGGWTTTNSRGSFGIEGALNDTSDRLVFTAPRYNDEQGILWNCVKTNGTWSVLNSVQNSTGFGDSLYANSDLSELIVGSGQGNTAVKGVGTIRFLTYDSATSTYTVTEQITSPTVTGTGFGYKIFANAAMDLLLVSARLVNSSTGEVYLYKKINGLWVMVYVYLASDRKPGEEFGVSFVMDEVNKEILICANAWSNQGIGSLYVHKSQIVEYSDRFIPINTEYSDFINEYSLSYGSSFGNNVKISGDKSTLVFSVSDFTDGVKTGRGSVHVYKKANGAWYKHLVIRNDEVGTNALAVFGYTISIDYYGTRLSIADINTNDRMGYIHVYRLENESAVLEYSRTQTEYTRSGYSGSGNVLNRNGDILIVGAATLVTGVSGNTGAIYIYKRTNTTWNLHQLIFSTRQDNGQLGTSAVISEDNSTIICGEWLGTNETQYKGGSANVYTLDANGNYSLKYELFGSGNTFNGANFGRTIAGSFDLTRVAISSRRDNEVIDQGGAVFVFRKVGNSWILEEKIKTPEIISGTEFGIGLACDKEMNLLAIGADNADSGLGKIYIYKRTLTNWTLVKTFSPMTRKPQDRLGVQLSMSDDGTELYSKMNRGETANGSGQVVIFDL